MEHQRMKSNSKLKKKTLWKYFMVTPPQRHRATMGETTCLNVTLCHKEVSMAWKSNDTPQYLWDVITCPRPRKLPLAHKFSYGPWLAAHTTLGVWGSAWWRHDMGMILLLFPLCEGCPSTIHRYVDSVLCGWNEPRWIHSSQRINNRYVVMASHERHGVLRSWKTKSSEMWIKHQCFLSRNAFASNTCNILPFLFWKQCLKLRYKNEMTIAIIIITWMWSWWQLLGLLPGWLIN